MGSYAVSYPADWRENPPDLPDLPDDVAPCRHFSPVSHAVPEPRVDIARFGHGCLVFDLIALPVELEEAVVAGYPAVRFETATDDYGYVVNLRDDGGRVHIGRKVENSPDNEECLDADGLIITGRDAVDDEQIRGVVDRMASTIEILGIPTSGER